MEPITESQAQDLRNIRPDAAAVLLDLEEIKHTIALACGHDDTDPDCPICHMFAIAADVFEQWERFGPMMDAVLERGPTRAAQAK